MIYQTYLPCSPLSQFVEFLWFREGYNVSKAQARLLPIGSMELVINLRSDTIPLIDRYTRKRSGNARGSTICGAHSEGFLIDIDSKVCVMGVHFRAGGGSPFFALPCDELHNQIVSLDELWNHRAEELRSHLLEAPTLEIRFRVLERFLLNMIVQQPKQHPAVAIALREFQCSPVPTVGAVTAQIGLSARHFSQLFRDEVGLTPKLFCRVQRLRQVLYLLAKKEQADWIDLALACGYFDQAHFIHDFRSFAGCTPTTYLEQRGLHPCHIVLPD
ncbi:helix-turn-helix domain-containing protein [Scytonema sp. UIC 10036]|uniref:helix-turn-helix domain-containing protein n=1 Tax=Scytonema sp. UIC 10036 TaxID=2304196 RepID=UPI0012DA7B6A|nr:helix-turn-helix domain-containing protein [Scytonema sp. UIC 10036]MUG99423.1 helix-turn-helix domain-containing protein [Scytonema sp. UIC 10036]